MSSAPETRYVSTPRGHLAYQATGTGERVILFLSGSITHVELRWEIPHLVRMYRRLLTLGRVVNLDPLGMGASDPMPDPPPTLEEAARDYLSVLDELGVERCSIVATLHGVPPALTIAADHPERVDKLVLLGGYARLIAAPDYPEGVDPSVIEAFFEMFLPLWGTGVPSSSIYGVEVDEHELPLYGRLERAAAAPTSMERILRWITSSDARVKIPLVRAPVLAYGIETRIVSLAATRAMVNALDGVVSYRELTSDPVTTGEGLDELMSEIAEFLTGSRAVAHADRELAAVLFTDLVGSTERAAELGDDAWRDLLSAFRLTVRRELDRYEGREVNTRGDDFLVMFDRASSAIECAVAVRDAVQRMGLEVRTGIHVGEVEMDADDLTGVAVHVGARVAALARAHEILVTTAAREAVAGMAWTFADRDVHELKGVPGEWHLWGVETSP